MANIAEASSPPNALAPTPNKANGLTKRSLAAIRELIAASFWIYAICKLFVFDIDVFLINRISPRYIWVAQYKFLILLAMISVALVITKNKYLLGWCLYILFYPLILLCWKLPRVAFKTGGWLFVFALANTAISTFTSIKYKFIAFSTFILATFAMLFLSNEILLLASIGCLICVLVSAYARMLILVFRPSTIFRVYSRMIRKCPGYFEKSLSDREIIDLPPDKLTETQVTSRRTNLQTILIANRALLFLGRRLRDYQDSRLNAVAYAFNLVLLLIFTVVSYSAINLALYKLDAQEYTLVGSASPFLFLYYSFHVFLFNGITEVSATGLYSQILSMSEQFFAIILLFILIVLFFSVRSEKYKDELSSAIREAEESGHVLDNLIRSTYRMTQAEALEEIRRMNSNLIGVIDWLSRDLK
jgi:hypothetical protein